MKLIKPILYAEDDENDAFLMERAFSKLAIANPLRIVPDGKLAIAYLAGTAPYADREEPCLCLLDLSMPGKPGLEVLKWIRNEPTLAQPPVVVLTSSNQESDIHRAYLLGADGYVIKPGHPHELLRIVTSMQDYWLGEIRPAKKFVDFASTTNVPPPNEPPANLVKNPLRGSA
jgi:CheY-like chemotaxis protein